MIKRNMFKQLDAAIERDEPRDWLSRMCYAASASPYQQPPVAVARPHHREDCVAIVEWARRHGRSLIPRTVGTSLAGRCVGEGLIIDVIRYMNHAIDIDADGPVFSPGWGLMNCMPRSGFSG
jgi:FAD/FMN-containing dehydrogenase